MLASVPLPSVWSTMYSTGSTSSKLTGIQAALHPIDHKHPLGTLKHRRVPGHDTYRPRTVDSDGMAGLDPGQHGGVPAGGEDVREHREVVLELVALLAG